MWHWGRKPPRGVPIDRSHPMAKDLVFFVALHHGSGNQQDLITGRIGAFTNTTDGSDPIYNQKEGVLFPSDMTLTTGKRGWDFGDMPGDHSDPWEIEYGCVITRARPQSIDGTDFHPAHSRILSMSNSAAGTDNYSINLDDVAGANNNIVFRVRNAPPTVAEVDITRAAGDYIGVLLDLAADCAPGGVNLDCYVWEVENNVFQQSLGNTSPEPIGASGENLTIGYRGPDNERTFGGSIEYIAVFDRAKGFDFIQTFRQNPWQIFEAATEEATGGGEQAGSLPSVGVGY